MVRAMKFKTLVFIALAALVISLWTVLDALQSPWGMSWLHGIYHKQGFVPY